MMEKILRLDPAYAAEEEGIAMSAAGMAYAGTKELMLVYELFLTEFPS